MNPALDADRPYRTRMVQDVRARCDTLGPVGAVLIGGDVAFKGDPQEYQVAFTWFNELAEACGCPLERVFVVPGNHDVDRGSSAVHRRRETPSKPSPKPYRTGGNVSCAPSLAMPTPDARCSRL